MKELRAGMKKKMNKYIRTLILFIYTVVSIFIGMLIILKIIK